ncbi:hypothetical protein BDR22DRAFT_963170 [Usnea florida]
MPNCLQKCKTTSQEIGSATVNMILDLSIVMLPLPVLWSLQMPLKREIMMSGILSLGLYICAINIIRVILVARLNATGFTYSFTYAGIFASLEVSLGIITACMPTLGPLTSRKTSVFAAQKPSVYSTERRLGLSSSSKGNTSDQIFKQRAFERLGDDELMLREVIAYGANSDGRANGANTLSDTSASLSTGDTAPEGVINVSTDMQVVNTPLSGELQNLSRA